MQSKTSQEVLEKWQVRKHRAQKTAFIEFVQSRILEARVEQGGLSRSRNIIVGDPDRARVIFTAHYDTCARLPIPNLLYPENLLFSIMYAVLTLVPIVLITILAAELGVPSGVLPGIFIGLIILLVIMMMGPVPNPHTVNDNTSGVVTLLELWERMGPEERANVALVFFDNEENGLLGSGVFVGKHKEALRERPLVNFDCVSHGDALRLVVRRRTWTRFGSAIAAALPEEAAKVAGKDFAAVPDGAFFFPSDNLNVYHGVGAAAFVRGKLGLYIPRIHTARDTIFDEANVQLMVTFARNVLAELGREEGEGPREAPLLGKGAVAKAVLLTALTLAILILAGMGLGWLLAMSVL